MGSILYELFHNCRYECVKEKETTEYLDEFNGEKEELSKQLNEEQQKKLKNIAWNLNMHYDEINYDICQKAIFFGIKLGMEI